jgi:coenzyme F420-reducing hydrogenase delta subunit
MYPSITAVARMPFEEQCRRADQVCATLVNSQMIRDTLKNPIQERDVFRLNGTSIGNMAYIARYAENEDTRTLAKNQLDNICSWVIFQDERQTFIEQVIPYLIASVTVLTVLGSYY